MSVCYKCPVRHHKCHADCEKYQAEREKLDRIIQARAKEVMITNVAIKKTQILKDKWMKGVKRK